MDIRGRGGVSFRLLSRRPVGRTGRTAPVDVASYIFAVQSVEQLGGETYLYGAVGGDVSFTVNVQGQSEIVGGDKVPLKLKPELVHVFDKDTTLSLRQ